MADNFNLGTPNLDDIIRASGFDPSHNKAAIEDIVSSQALKQKQQEQLVAEATERIKQAKLQSVQKQEAADLGVNAEMKDVMTIQEAVAHLKAAGVKEANIAAFVEAIGDQKVVSRTAVQDVILKKSSSGNLNLVGAKEGQPMQGEDGKWYRTWIKRTPEQGILMTDRVSPTGVAVFQAEDPEGYQAGKTMLSIQDPKLAATTKVAGARETMATQKVEQNKIKNWNDLRASIDPETKSGQNALALAGRANQRADRVFATLAEPGEMTWQRMNAIKTDIAGIFIGGVPPIVSLSDQDVHSWQQKAAKIVEFFTGRQAEDLVPMDLMRQMFNLTKEIKAIDNEIINNELEISSIGAEDVIKKDPARWERLKAAVLETGHSVSEDAAHEKLFEGSPSSPKAGKADGSTEKKKAALRAKIAAMGK